MAEPEPVWLQSARGFLGQDEIPGSASNPAIMQMPATIAAKFPSHTKYAANYTNDDIAWCGVFVGVNLALANIEPVFGPTDTDKWMWAEAWSRFGVPLDKPRLGAIMVFPRHVGFYVGEDGDYYLILGGNQSNTVKISRIAKDTVEAIRWPATVAKQTTAVAPTDLRRQMGKVILDSEARRDSQGRLAVYQLPAGDGGGTYEVAGINDRYHPTEAAHLAGLIRAGRHDEAEAYAIDFMVRYTDVVVGWNVDSGVEFYLRDCAFNRGPTGAARIFQRALMRLGHDLAPDGEDGDVGPLTLAASNMDATPDLLSALRAARESYERDPVGRDESSKFWRGLVNRWNNALSAARKFSLEAPMPDPATPPTGPVFDMTKVQRALDKMSDIMATWVEIEPLLRALAGSTARPPTQQPPTEQPPKPPAETPPVETTGSAVAKNAAGGILGVLGAIAGWYNGGLSDTAAVNTGLAAIAGGALSAYSPLINIGLNVASRLFQGWAATKKPPS